MYDFIYQCNQYFSYIELMDIVFYGTKNGTVTEWMIMSRKKEKRVSLLLSLS